MTLLTAAMAPFMGPGRPSAKSPRKSRLVVVMARMYLEAVWLSLCAICADGRETNDVGETWKCVVEIESVGGLRR